MWTSIINEITESGVSLRELSERTQIPASTLSELRNKKIASPKWEAGQRLIKVREELLGPLPVETVQSRAA